MLLLLIQLCVHQQVVGQNADTISPIAVDAVLRVIDPLTAINCDLRDIKVHRNTDTDVNECHMHHAISAVYIYASVRHFAALAVSNLAALAVLLCAKYLKYLFPYTSQDIQLSSTTNAQADIRLQS
jgi:hypothetical protein